MKNELIKKPEILAPAGGMEQLIAAVRCGANAVYLGTQGFNARQNAKNFSDSQLCEAVSYCHARNVAVHVTLNTLIFDNEISDLIKKAESIAKSGADAIIVQDIAAAKIIRECCPDISMHASTQMTIHNTAGVRMAQELGFSRAVLARELTFEEIGNITEKSHIETEVFVHGALCTCVSGACYLSSMLGGRSGNRGFCAQPCRLDFRNESGRGYALSLKDMSFVSDINKLCETGVASFKIEGRMKRPEYVAAAVTAVKAAIDGKAPDMNTLENVFSRSGFTNGYFTGKRNISMYGHRTKDDVEASSNVLGSIASLYRAERQSVPVDMEIVIKQGKAVELCVTDGVHYISNEGAVPENAIKMPADAEYVRKALSKTGGTPFYVDRIDAHIEGNVTVSTSQLNNMRRSALESLLEQRSIVFPHDFVGKEMEIPQSNRNLPYKLRLRFEKLEQAVNYSQAEKIILPMNEILANKACANMFNGKLVAEIPQLLWEKDSQKLAESIDCLKTLGINEVMCSNLGAVEAAKNAGCIIHGDYGLNITNSIALDEYGKMGLSDATLSFELGMSKIKSLGGKLRRGILGYGYLPLMKLRVCPAQKPQGCKDCSGRPFLTDRTGVKFPLLCKDRRYTELLNSVPLYIGDKNITGVDFVTLYFTFEDKKTVNNVICLFADKMTYAAQHTNGLYYRDVL